MSAAPDWLEDPTAAPWELDNDTHVEVDRMAREDAHRLQAADGHDHQEDDDPPWARLDAAPRDYITKDGGLLTKRLADAVASVGPIRAGLGGRVWHYRDGVWLPDGANEVARRTRALLGDRWRPAHAKNIVEWYATDEPFIGDIEPVDVLNTRSGLLDWRTGRLGPHNAELPTTYQIPHQWDPTATCPTVDQWLTEVFPADAIGFAWELLGYLLLPANVFHKAVLLHGSGRNGKGTYLRLATALLGRHNVANKTLQELGEDRFAIAGLYRKVANIGGDLDARTLKRTDAFKMATGGDRVDAQEKYGQPFSFDPICTFLFAANELPGTVDVTEGFFSRWLVVPFTGYFPDGVADRTLESRLHAEIDGVLVKAVAGLRDLMERGAFDVPTTVLAATTDYRDRADPVRQFINERLTVDVNANTVRTQVYAAYRNWCEEAGHQPLATRRFYDRLRTSIPVDERKIHGTRMIAGIALHHETATP